MPETYFASRKKKPKIFNKQKKSGGLGKNGQVYQNDLLDTDYTSVTQTAKKLK